MREFKAKIPYDTYQRIFFRKERDGFGDKSWADWLGWLSKDVSLKLTIGGIIQQTTRKGLLDLWLSNFAENLPYIRHGQNIQIRKSKKPKVHTIADLGNPEPTNKPERSAIVVGAGPSVWKNKHLDMLAKSDYSGYVVATDRMLVPLLEKGIIPHLTVTVDGSEIIKKFYDNPLVKKYGPHLKLALVTSVNPKIVQIIIKNKCTIYWFNPMFDVWSKDDSYTKILYTLSKVADKGPPLTQAGGNCGTTSWVFAWELLKASPIGLIGIDFGYLKDTNLKETPYYSSLLHLGKKQAVHSIKEVYQEVYHPVFKTWAKSDYVFRHYKKAFLSLVKSAKPWVHTINCTEGGTLFGPKIECMPFADFLRRYPT